ncbi:MAG: hypothetical protein L0I89_06225 [Tetragenococcus halophilus]|nr:hypothetical protein [Tetragenococcus halophilus]MDN6129189.1 hypothetical protein [Tetragenococcus halophilus]MDN6144055.1 hypothetical protein [Tetragenococcus halophilus]MDN6153553.1 hypothetical protein [Tetragenococcus halophilus]MDN6163735.1 hypothetical protein [Tetragenococcus halophilus]
MGLIVTIVNHWLDD